MQEVCLKASVKGSSGVVPAGWDAALCRVKACKTGPAALLCLAVIYVTGLPSVQQCDLLLSSSCYCPPPPGSCRTVLCCLPRALCSGVTPPWCRMVDGNGARGVSLLLASHWRNGCLECL